METKPPSQKGPSARGWLFIGFVVLIIAALTPFAVRLGRQTARTAQARQEVAKLKEAVSGYYRTFGETPGNPRAKILFSALSGLNAKGIIFFSAPYSRFNPEGELIDPWRHPYQLDVTDPYNPRIYSFGPNGRDEGGAQGSDDIVSWR
jgi:hypothetical protein